MNLMLLLLSLDYTQHMHQLGNMRKTTELLCEYLKGVDDNKKKKDTGEDNGSAEIKGSCQLGLA